jgi:mono/diheme cytochrome c family protein
MFLAGIQNAAPQNQSSASAPVPRAVLDKYCVTCHNQKLRTAGLTLDTLDVADASANAEIWERVIEKLRAGSMPPPGNPRPDAETYRAVATWLEGEIDRAWAANPNPGRIGAVHRLNRTEYNNAIRDLFNIDLDVKSLLPGDETADGSFDNFADSLSISTAHLERYLSVARQVTRLATGLPPSNPKVDRFEIPLHVLQEDRQNEDLPFGSRGGIAIHYNFAANGEYLVKVRLQRQYQDYIKGMGWPQQLDVRLDGKLIKRFTVGGGAKGRPAATSYAGDGEPGFAGDDEWEK